MKASFCDDQPTTACAPTHSTIVGQLPTTGADQTFQLLGGGVGLILAGVLCFALARRRWFA
jgi:LPXTG-motif cell wall-anchored protein